MLDTVIFPFPEGTAHSVDQTAHTVLATLIGITLDRGLLPRVDLPVVELLAEGPPPGITDIDPSLTVEHLLTMSTGLDCGSGDEMLRSPETATSQPGNRFAYCDRASSLLAAVVAAVTEGSTADFAAEALFEPLDIVDYSWPKRHEGNYAGVGELALLPIDLAKIGYLYLQGGIWDGHQVVSTQWTETATTAHIETLDSVESLYGYGWYIYSGFIMSNRGDQAIVIVPELELVAVFTSGLPPTRAYLPEMLATQYLLDAIRPHPAPAQPDSQARLEAAVAAAATGPEPVDAETPPMARLVDGVPFVIDSRSGAWLRICFKDGTATLEHEIGSTGATPFALFDSAGPTSIEIGLEGRFIVDEISQPPLAWRGEWRNDSTLALTYQVIGDAPRGRLMLEFGDDRVDLQIRDTTAGTVREMTAHRAG